VYGANHGIMNFLQKKMITDRAKTALINKILQKHNVSYVYG